MRTVRSLRKCSPHDKLCRWRERETERERAGGEGGRERKKDNAVPSSNRLIQNPLHMIQKYSTVWIIHPWLSALKPLDCVGPTHTITSHLQPRHSLPDRTLTQQITTVNTQLLSMFPPFHLTKNKKQKKTKNNTHWESVWKASRLTHTMWQDPRDSSRRPRPEQSTSSRQSRDPKEGAQEESRATTWSWACDMRM